MRNKKLLIDGKPCAMRVSDGYVFRLGIYTPDTTVWALTSENNHTFIVDKKSDKYRFYNIEEYDRRTTKNIIAVTDKQGCEECFDSWNSALYSKEANKFFGVQIRSMYLAGIFEHMKELASQKGFTDQWKKGMQCIAENTWSCGYMYAYDLDGYTYFIDPCVDNEYGGYKAAVIELCRQLGFTVEEKTVYA